MRRLTKPMTGMCYDAAMPHYARDVGEFAAVRAAEGFFLICLQPRLVQSQEARSTEYVH
jgi:hypothetical protein